MRVDDGWSDIVIRNISPRGMLIRSHSPPPTGAYVEIRCARTTAIGRAVWAKDEMIGIRLQDRLQLEALLGTAKGGAGNLRLDPRAHPGRFLANVAERSRDNGRKLQSLALLLVVALAAMALAKSVAMTLAAPFDTVRQEMGAP